MASKFLNVLATLPYVASKSQITHRHSAVIIKNGAPIIWGFNNIKGADTYHAEHDAIRKYLAMKRILWNKRKCKKN